MVFVTVLICLVVIHPARKSFTFGERISCSWIERLALNPSVADGNAITEIFVARLYICSASSASLVL